MTKLINRKYIISTLIIIGLATLLLIPIITHFPGIKTTRSTLGYEKYFDESSVMTVDIIADDATWNKMLSNASEEKYIKCDVMINGERINQVGIRPKGNASLQQVAVMGSQRYSFKIEFDHYIKNQTFHGLDKLVLNNILSDASYMKEYMSYEIFKAVGVTAPLHSYAQIKRNGLDCGLYLALEAMEESYISRNYVNHEGKLYKPENENFLGVITSGQAASILTEAGNPLTNDRTQVADQISIPEAVRAGLGRTDTGEIGLVYQGNRVQDYPAIYKSAVFKTTEEDFQRVIEAVKHLSNGTDLEKYIDIDATLRYFAAQTFIVNFDSYYGSQGHNYYLYEKDGLLTMLPWDLNLAFAGYYSGDTKSAINYPIDTPLNEVSMEQRPMLSKLLEVSEYKEKYHKYLKQIVEAYIKNDKFGNEIEKLNQLIKPYVEKDPTSFYTLDEYEAAVPVLKKFALLRADSISGQLSGIIPSTMVGQAENTSSSVDSGSLDVSILSPKVIN